MLGSAKNGTILDGTTGGTGIRIWESNVRKVSAGGKKLLSLDNVDDRSPSRIRGMFHVVWLMARDTSWQNSTDFFMMTSFGF